MSKPMRHSMVRGITLLCALAPTAFANTYVIDDDGGPGVDFTNIAPAIAAAQPGDVLLVRAGNYSGFTLTKGLSILGETGVSLSGFSYVDSLPAGQVAVLTDLHVRSLMVTSCDGTVIVQRVTAGMLGYAVAIHSSKDVRLWGVTSQPTMDDMDPSGGRALSVGSSRVEVVQSTLIGATAPGDESQGLPGAPGVAASDLAPQDAGLLHLALTSVTGGGGGFSLCCGAGQGGAGVWVGGSHGSDVVIAGGDLAFIRGGLGGCAHHPAIGGPALKLQAPGVRRSGVDLIPGDGCAGPGPVIEASDPSYVVTPGYADPTLGVSGSTAPGGVLQFQIRAHARSRVFLNYGRTPIVQSDSFAQIGVLVDVDRGLKLGAIPVSGEIDRAFPIPSNAAVGSLFVFQAVVILPNGELRRTNSIPVIVR